MSGRPSWTTPSDLRAEVQRLWDRGLLLSTVAANTAATAAVATADPPLVFPKRLRLRRPTSQELLDRFDEARAWVGAISSVNHIRVETAEVNHRVLGANRLPQAAWVDSLDGAVAVLGRQKDVARFEAVCRLTVQRRPQLLGWLQQRPLTGLDLASDWERLLAVVDWIEAHPNSGRYLRQVSVAGVDTKFIETHRKALSELIDRAVPGAIIDPEASGTKGFLARYGFRAKPILVRFRILDPDRQLLASGSAEGADVSVDAATFAGLDPGVGRVLFTENETNFLAMPPMADAMVVLAGGFGTERLAGASWLAKRQLLYWGDIDTHGFAILDEIRRRFAHIESFLMDRETFEAFEEFWGTEPSPESRDLPRLDEAEASLYDDLRSGVYGRHLRLEQEQISYDWFLAALEGRGTTT